HRPQYSSVARPSGNVSAVGVTGCPLSPGSLSTSAPSLSLWERPTTVPRGAESSARGISPVGEQSGTSAVVFPSNSYAPLSHSPNCDRLMPRWSFETGQLPGPGNSTAGLSRARMAWVSVPLSLPLTASGPSLGSTPLRSPPGLNPHGAGALDTLPHGQVAAPAVRSARDGAVSA